MNRYHRASIDPDIDDEPLGDTIRADPVPTLKYTFVALAGMMAGFIVGCVFGHVSASPGDSPAPAPGSPVLGRAAIGQTAPRSAAAAAATAR